MMNPTASIYRPDLHNGRGHAARAMRQITARERASARRDPEWRTWDEGSGQGWVWPDRPLAFAIDGCTFDDDTFGPDRVHRDCLS